MNIAKLILMALAWYSMWHGINGDREKTQQGLIGFVAVVILFGVMNKI